MELHGNKMKIVLPKLKGKETFRSWSEGVQRYLKTKSLDIYLNHHFRMVRKLKEALTKVEIDKVIRQLIDHDVIYHIPIEERVKLTQEKPKFYSATFSDDIPDDMLSFIDLCDIIQTSKEVILLVPQENYIELARKMREDKSKVFSMFHTTVSTPIFELIRSQASVADAYDTLKKSYQLDTYVEQQNLRVKINKLYIGKLQSYLDNFEQHLAEYTSIGGSRQDTALYDTFVRHISGSKYKIYYNERILR